MTNEQKDIEWVIVGMDEAKDGTISYTPLGPFTFTQVWLTDDNTPPDFEIDLLSLENRKSK